MIKFFRKIRQKLLVDNRFNKYLLYAIGEIILVVIGILIALQINNWNEVRKAKQNELVLLQKLQEENILNIESIKNDVEYRKEVPLKTYNFIRLLQTQSLEVEKKKTEKYLAEILQSSAYTFIQSSLKNYINQYNAKNSELTKELSKLEFYQNDLILSSDKGLDIKIKYIFEELENDVDFSTITISSYNTLKSLSFKNKMIITSEIEDEISSIFSKTYSQMIKVDSLVSRKINVD